MARANCRYHPRANAEHNQNADPNDGSHDGRLGGADQITQPDDRLTVGDAVEARLLARRQPGRQLAKRKRVGRRRTPCSFGCNSRSSGRRHAQTLCRFGPRPASHMMTPDCAAADLAVVERWCGRLRLHYNARGGEGESLTRSARNRRRRFGHNATATRSDRHAAFPRAKACTSAVVRALPPIPQSPLSTSSTTHQVTPRMLSPSIETIASVSLLIIWRFCSLLNTSLMTRT